MKRINTLPEWQALQAHYAEIASQKMSDWFVANPNRFQDFSIEVGEILFDYSRNRATSETLKLLINLANAIDLPRRIENLFSGHPVNITEKRAALHTALRDKATQTLYLHGKNIMPEIRATQDRIQKFADVVRTQQWLGATQKPIRDIVNIGIGGSHLGPAMALHALQHYQTKNLRCFFISNIDGAHITEVLQQIDPERTLFIISSKSFSTLETLTNAKTLRTWLEKKLGTADLTSHFVAITAEMEKAYQWGIPREQIFPLWDWIGGRFSIWSAIGLPLVLMLGMNNFLELLAGAHSIDQHFQQASFDKNIPVVMSLMGIWYINFFQAHTHAIIPYSHQLLYFCDYLQQLDMESNGKSMTQHGTETDYVTSPVVWGEQGCNAQHAFHQLLHQGRHLVPIDFILAGKSHTDLEDHHDILVASCLTQAKALMQGKSHQEAYNELIASGYGEAEARELAQHKMMIGNRPCNILFADKITPYNLGALLAIYEHKIFVQGAIWNINSFDQWGVNLGKELLPPILTDLQQEQVSTQHDAATLGLIQHYRKLKSQV